ncbi:MAG: hypothetical protein ACI4HO_02285 [Ruminococcus sp.]
MKKARWICNKCKNNQFCWQSDRGIVCNNFTKKGDGLVGSSNRNSKKTIKNNG